MKFNRLRKHPQPEKDSKALSRWPVKTGRLPPHRNKGVARCHHLDSHHTAGPGPCGEKVAVRGMKISEEGANCL